MKNSEQMKRVWIAFFKALGVMCVLAAVVLIIALLVKLFGNDASTIFIIAAAFVVMWIVFYKLG